MSFTLPQMPLLMNAWPLGSIPVQGPPTLQRVPCSLTLMKPTDMPALYAPLSSPPTHIIRTLSVFNLQDNGPGTGRGPTGPTSILEVPAGSGNFYKTVLSVIIGRGFPNEHRRMYVQRATVNPSGD